MRFLHKKCNENYTKRGEKSKLLNNDISKVIFLAKSGLLEDLDDEALNPESSIPGSREYKL